MIGGRTHIAWPKASQEHNISLNTTYRDTGQYLGGGGGGGGRGC